MIRPVALSAILAATPAAADITADQLWRDLDAIPGVSGKVTREAGRIVVSDLTFAPPPTFTEPTLAASLKALVLTDTGQGSVEVTASPEIKVLWTEDTVTSLKGTIAIPDARAFVSGSLRPGELWFDSAFPSIAPDLTETGPGATDRATFSGTLTDLTAALTRPSADDGLASMTLVIGTGDLRLKGSSANQDLDVALRLAGFDAAARMTPGYLTDPPLMPAGRLAVSISADSFEADVRAPTSLELKTLIVSLSGLAAKSAIDIGAQPADKSFPGASVTGDLSLAALSYIFEPGLDARQDGTAGSARGRQSDFTLAGRVVVPPRMDDAEVTAALNAGLAVDLRMGFGEGDSNGDVPLPGIGLMALTTKAAGGSVAFSMSRSGFLFDVTQQGTTFRATVPGRADPFDGSFGDVVTRISGPLVRTAAAQPFELVLRLADLSLSEAVWGLFDPAATIPRDPATVSIRMSGTAEVTGDLLADDRAPDDIPLRPRRLDLTEAILSAGGARVTGSGALDFPQDVAVTPPTGQVDISWKGVYGLLDKLTALGAVPLEAGLGIRGGLGMIARPVGPDDLTTRFEFREGGKIFANGAPLPDFD